jgi:hypothetical protein
MVRVRCLGSERALTAPAYLRDRVSVRQVGIEIPLGLTRC